MWHLTELDSTEPRSCLLIYINKWVERMHILVYLDDLYRLNSCLYLLLKARQFKSIPHLFHISVIFHYNRNRILQQNFLSWLTRSFMWFSGIQSINSTNRGSLSGNGRVGWGKRREATKWKVSPARSNTRLVDSEWSA